MNCAGRCTTLAGMATTRTKLVLVAGITIVAMALGACSDDGSKPPASGAGRSDRSTTTSQEREPTDSHHAIVAGTAGSFEFTDGGRLQDRPLKVWYDAPSDDLTTAP